MDRLPGKNCAALLMAMDLPFATMVRCLVEELELTVEEAETALFAATPKALADARLRPAAAVPMLSAWPTRGLFATPKSIERAGWPPRTRCARSTRHR